MPTPVYFTLAVLALVLNATPARATDARAEGRPPNVILILADDLGWGDLACYGNKSIHTPHLDRMAAEGVRFTQAYAGSTVCSPSRAVLMTGKHTGHAYQRSNDGKDIRPEDVTVAEVMKGAGYAAGLIGKWGIASPGTTGVPTKKGFDFFYGYLGNMHAHNYYPDFLYRGEKKEALPNEVPFSKDGRGAATKKVVYSNDRFLEESLKFIDQRKGNPFFLYLPFTIPHANNEAAKATGDGMEVPDLGDYASKAGWPAARKGHAAMVSRLDGYVGRIIAHVKELGIENDTLILFTSDNGPHSESGYDPEMNDSNGALRGKKRDLYEGGIRVPLIARWPGKIAPSRTSTEVVWFADVLPTLAELGQADAAKLPKHDGISIVPTLRGDDAGQRHHEFLYWESYEQGSKQAVRMGKWKAVRLPAFTGTTELYDLDTDPGEVKNLAAANPEVVRKLEGIMQESHTPPGDPSKQEPRGAAGKGENP